MRKLLLVLVLLGAVSSIYAEKGKISYIPKLKIGHSKAAISAISYSEEEGTIGGEIDILYGLTERFEVGAGMSIEKNYIVKEVGKAFGDSESTTFSQLFVTGRYNFINTSELTPFIQAKAGVARGGEFYYYSGYDSDGSYESASLDIDPSLVYGISTGIEYHNVSIELGYEIIEMDLEVRSQDNNIDRKTIKKEEDIQTIYLSVGYRF